MEIEIPIGKEQAIREWLNRNGRPITGDDSGKVAYSIGESREPAIINWRLTNADTKPPIRREQLIASEQVVIDLVADGLFEPNNIGFGSFDTTKNFSERLID